MRARVWCHGISASSSEGERDKITLVTSMGPVCRGCPSRENISRKRLCLRIANGELAVSGCFDYLVADVACEMRWAG